MDQIYKLQPHRTMALQGFDDLRRGCGTVGARRMPGSPVSGVFRDLADFAVLVLFQKDDPFGHPLFSYLPGRRSHRASVLDFDVTWQGMQSWNRSRARDGLEQLDYSVNGGRFTPT